MKLGRRETSGVYQDRKSRARPETLILNNPPPHTHTPLEGEGSETLWCIKEILSKVLTSQRFNISRLSLPAVTAGKQRQEGIHYKLRTESMSQAPEPGGKARHGAVMISGLVSLYITSGQGDLVSKKKKKKKVDICLRNWHLELSSGVHICVHMCTLTHKNHVPICAYTHVHTHVRAHRHTHNWRAYKS